MFYRILVVACSLLLNSACANDIEPNVNTIQELKITKLSLDRTSVRQGEFFYVTISNAKSNPKVFFNSKEYPAFLIAEDTYRSLVPVENLTKPGSYAVLARISDTWEEKIPVKIIDNGKGVSYIHLGPEKTLDATAKELNEVGAGLKTLSADKLWVGKFIYPSKAAKSSPFGVKRSYNNGPIDSYHKGLDFAGALGSPVYAPAAGRVATVGYEKDGFVVHGNTIILDHGQGLTSIYMHLNRIDVKQGDNVTAGQLIGAVGHTGISTGPHLHWGVYLSGTSVEPELFVSKDIF